MITFDTVSLGYERKVVLRGLSFHIERGSFAGVVGGNGAGKTTLLRAIVGDLKPMSGTIHTEYERIGYVPQVDVDSAFWPITVRNYLTLFGGTRESITRTLTESNVLPLANTSMQEISGGERRRVLLARAQLHTPDLLILDEAMTGVDARHEAEYMNRLTALNDAGITILFVTHDLNVLRNIGKHLFVINDGTVVDAGENGMNDATFTRMYGTPVSSADGESGRE